MLLLAFRSISIIPTPAVKHSLQGVLTCLSGVSGGKALFRAVRRLRASYGRGFNAFRALETEKRQTGCPIYRLSKRNKILRRLFGSNETRRFSFWSLQYKGQN